MTEQSYSEPIDLRFRIGGLLKNPMTDFDSKDAAIMFEVSESEVREDSVIDIIGTDMEREMMSMISEHTELPSMSTISFFESSVSDSEDLLNANFANVPRNNYGRHVLTVSPMQAERLTRQIPTRPDVKW